MSDDQQRRDAEQRRRFGLPQGVDLHNFDPRKAMDPNALAKIQQAQAVARAEAQAATTVVIATIVSLVTSAFSFVAALAWNNAIQLALDTYVNTNSALAKQISPVGVKLFYALIVTVIAIIVILIVNRFAGNIAKKSAIALASGN